MKKIVLTLGAMALGSIANVQADQTSSFSMGMEVPKSCSFASMNAGSNGLLTLNLNSNTFSKSVNIGQSSCNAATYWEFASTNGGLQIGGGGAAGSFAQDIPYTAIIDISPSDPNSSDNVGFTSNIPVVAPFPQAPLFSENLTMVIEPTGAVNPANFVSGNYQDTLTVTVTFVP